MLISIDATVASTGTDTGALQVVYNKAMRFECTGLPRCTYYPRSESFWLN